MAKSLPSLIDAAYEAAHIGGEVISHYFRSKKDIGLETKGINDLVTKADREAEDKITDFIRKTFPHHHILAEESGESGKHSDITWYIDPIDGTTNFAHGYPFCCVSIGVESKEEGPLAAVVYNPNLNECFTAEKGSGAFLNKKKIVVSTSNTLKDSLLATGFPYTRRGNEMDFFEQFKSFMLNCQGIRRDGSAALNLCYVAAGIFDGFWEVNLNPWDISAGRLLILEAGGKLTHYDGSAFSYAAANVLANNKYIHDEMLEILAVK